MSQGDFVWYELCTTDPVAAAEFYSNVVGWTVKPSGLPGMDYSLVCLEDRPVAGILNLQHARMPPRPMWFGYIAVDDVDAKVRQIAALGGSIVKAPEDVPSIGRFAVVADPQGAHFMVFKGTGEAPPPPAMMQPGSVGWHELHAADWEMGWPFYENIFGWTRDRIHDMGSLGSYQLFKTSSFPIGGMMSDRTRASPPHWLYYFAVEDIDAAVDRVKTQGGRVPYEPQEVPGGAWIIHAQDPQGGTFALVGMKSVKRDPS